MDSLVADGTLGPALVAEGQVVKHAGPAEDVSAARDASRHRRVEADGAGRHLVAVDALQEGRSLVGCRPGGLVKEADTHHLLHAVPVDQSVWIGEVGLVVLVVRHHKLAAGTKTDVQNAVGQWKQTPPSSSSLCLEEQLLVERLVLVAPLVSAAPVRMAAVSDAVGSSAGFEGEVQQVIQADLFGSSKLSRAELGPAGLCYLQGGGGLSEMVLQSNMLTERNLETLEAI